MRYFAAMLGLFLMGTSFVRADTITANVSFDLPFAIAGGGNPLLPAFNPALGTLNSVDLLLTLELTTTTQLINTMVVIDPVFGTPMPVPVNGVAGGTSIVMLNAGGLPVLTTSVITPAFPFALPPAGPGTATTVGVAVDDVNVPGFEVSSFSRVGFAPLLFSAQEFVTINTFPVGGGIPQGSVINAGTTTDFKGSILAIYDYTPNILIPEAGTGGVLASALLGFAAMSVHRRKYKN